MLAGTDIAEARMRSFIGGASMSGLASLQLAVELAIRQRDQLRLDLAQAQQVQASAQQQADQLEGYARETQARWVTQSTRVAAPEVMRHYYQFMDKLYQAIAMQAQVMQDAEQRVARWEQCLLQAEFTLASRQTVRDKLHRDALSRRDKLEQKQFDEMAALQYRKNMAGHYRGGEL
jgi:flagellar FliJ protein